MARLDDIVNLDDLRDGIGAGLINARFSGDGQRIYNYSNAAMYTPGAWDNPAVRACRGLIVDEEYRVVARPWAKFFNYGQSEAGELDMSAPVEVTDKMDGSLLVLHYDPDGGTRAASRGSFESDQATHASKLLRRDHDEIRWPRGFTPLAELISPFNRIVCDYGQTDQVVLLGGVWIDTGRYVGPTEAAAIMDWNGATTTTFEYKTLKEALEAPPRVGAEGLCVRYLDQNKIVKIKQEDYVLLHKIVTGLSEKSVWEHLMTEAPIEDLLDRLPDELHEWTRIVAGDLLSSQVAIKEKTMYTFSGIKADTRKEFAEEAKKHPDITPYLFMMYDGRPADTMILKTLRPRGDSYAKYISEDVA